MEYKYYILDSANSVQGVISDSDGKIVYEDLKLSIIKNDFSGKDEIHLVPYPESPIRESDAKNLSDNFEKVRITKDYWEALHYAGGPKRKAVSESTES